MGAVGTRLGIPIVRGGCPPPEQAAGHEAESETQIARQAEDDGGVGTAAVADAVLGRTRCRFGRAADGPTSPRSRRRAAPSPPRQKNDRA
jgi:hypothetical protein